MKDMEKCGVCGRPLPSLIAKTSVWTVPGRKFGGRPSQWAIEVRHHPGCNTAVECVPMAAKVVFSVPPPRHSEEQDK